MPVPASFVRFWRELDGLFSTVAPTPWGAVVTDGRFPRIWDANYARVDRPVTALRADDVLGALVPAARAAGADWLHVVSLCPEETTDLLAGLSSLGHPLSWDLLLRIDGPAAPLDGPVAEPLAHDAELWEAVRASFAWFGIEPDEAVAQLRTIEREVLAPGGKRWFGVRDPDGTLASVGAVHRLAGVAYIDNVATRPDARGRGGASAVTARLVAEARAEGVDEVYLLADPDDEAVVRLYRRLGFREAGRIGSTRGPLPA